MKCLSMPINDDMYYASKWMSLHFVVLIDVDYDGLYVAPIMS